MPLSSRRWLLQWAVGSIIGVIALLLGATNGNLVLVGAGAGLLVLISTDILLRSKS